jgi:PAS domain S-box-containing protein
MDDQQQGGDLVHAGRRILVVDDERDFADTLVQLLKLEGFQVEVAYTLSAAEKTLENFAADIALIDIRIGNVGGKTDAGGLSLAATIRQSYPDLTCIMMTAYASVETAVAALKEGAYDYLSKPFFTQDLMATISRCFERNRLVQDRDRAEAALRERNLELEALNTRLQNLVNGMQTLSTRTTLHMLCTTLVSQAIDITGAGGGSITVRIADHSVIEHRIGLSSTDDPAADNGRLEFPLVGMGREEIGAMTVEPKPGHWFTQQDREFGQILVSYANEAVHLLHALERVSWSEARLRDIIDYSPSLIFLRNLDGQLLVVNKRIEEWHGRYGDDAVGRTVDEIFPPETARLYAVQGDEVSGGERKLDEEVTITFADGSIHSVLITSFPVFTDDGKLMGIGTIATDVTRRRRIEEQLRHALKMEALGQLTGGVAHDFNNLLAVICGNLSLVEEEIGGSSEIADLVADASAAAQTGAELTHRLLAFGRQQALKPQRTDAHELILKMSMVLRRTLGETIELKEELNENLWAIEVDRSQLETSILNLALNARDAMPNGGILRIMADNATVDRQAQPKDARAGQGQFVVIGVSDTGIGMTADVLDRAAQPFYTTKDVGYGSGLGLSMVYGFVEQSGGHLDISSVPEQGTTVRLFLPRATRRAKTPPPGEERSSGGACQGEKVLVVEDQPNVRKLARRVLKRLGYDVLDAGDGSAALALMAETNDIDLLFTDVILPGGMSGIELANAAQARHPGLRVLYTSGYSPDLVLGKLQFDKDILLIRKPFRKEDLARMIRHALDAEVA